MTLLNSHEMFLRAKTLIPGGVNSPVRAFQSVGGEPVYMARGKGAVLTDVDGNDYIDFCGSWGPMILGHCHPEVVSAVREAVAEGMSFGTCSPREVEMAKLLRESVPSLQKVRLVNSGTEATMSALRLARGVTGRSKIVKFDGCYHGHADYLLVSAGSGLLSGGVSTSAGVTEGATRDVLVAPYNDIEAVERILQAHGDDVAAVIVEPVAGNMGLVKPDMGFLEGLRKLSTEYGALLIFDEVITGFRLGPTTYSTLIGVEPDLICLGKIIGGGMPIGAFGGRSMIMDRIAPCGDVYQAGTLSGNPVALAAGVTTIQILKRENPYPRMARQVDTIATMINDQARRYGVGLRCDHEGGMFTVFFNERAPLRNLADVKRSDTRMFAKYHSEMLKRGIYLPPSQFELNFISMAHTDEHVERFMDAVSGVLRTLKDL